MPQKIRMEVGELPEPGKLYAPKNQSLEIYKNLEMLKGLPDPDDKLETCGVIPKDGLFLFVRSVHEERIPGQIKRVWFKVIYGEMIGVSYNGQIPFHQFLLKVVE